MNRYRRHAEAQKSKPEAPMHSDDAIYFVMSDGNVDDYEFSSPAIKRWKSANSEERNSLTGGRKNGLQHHNHNNHHHSNGVGGIGSKSWHREPVVGSRTANGRKISFRSQNKDPVLTELNGQDEEVSVTARITSCMIPGGDLSLDSHGSYYQDDGFIFATNDLTLTNRGNGLAVWTASTAREEATETTEVTLGPEGDNNYVLDKPEIPPEFSLSGAGETESYVTTEIVDHHIVEEETVVTGNIVEEESVVTDNIIVPATIASVADEGAVVVNSDPTNYNDLLILNDPVVQSSSSSQVGELDPGAGESSGADPVTDVVSGEPQEDVNGGVSLVEMNGFQYVVLKIGEKTILIPSDTYKEYIDAQVTGDEEKAAEFIRQVQAACTEESEQCSVEPDAQALFESTAEVPVATSEEQLITDTVTHVPVDEQLPESDSQQQVSIDDQISEPVPVDVGGQRLPDCPDLDAM